jgi:hypothetical protein
MGILGAALLGVVVFAGWFVYKNNQEPVVTNFAECAAQKDAKIQESYPEVCVYKNQSFTNPNQIAEEPLLEFVAMSDFEGASERFTSFAKSVTGQTSGDEPCLSMAFVKESGDYVQVVLGQGVLSENANGNPICEAGSGGAAAFYNFMGPDYVLVFSTQDQISCELSEGFPTEIIPSCTDADGNSITR